MRRKAGLAALIGLAAIMGAGAQSIYKEYVDPATGITYFRDYSGKLLYYSKNGEIHKFTEPGLSAVPSEENNLEGILNFMQNVGLNYRTAVGVGESYASQFDGIAESKPQLYSDFLVTLTDAYCKSGQDERIAQNVIPRLSRVAERYYTEAKKYPKNSEEQIRIFSEFESIYDRFVSAVGKKNMYSGKTRDYQMILEVGGLSKYRQKKANH